MKKETITGFIVSDGAESFTRHLKTGTTKQIVPTAARLPFHLDKICIAQQPLGFDDACNYAKIAAKENDFYFSFITEDKRSPAETMIEFVRSQFTKIQLQK